MKRLALILAALFLTSHSFAAFAGNGSINNAPTKHNTSTGYLTLDIDWSGLAAASLGLTVTGSSVTYQALNTLALHPNIEDQLGSMSPTAADAYKYLTPSALTTVTIFNGGTGAGTVWVGFSNSSAAMQLSGTALACVPGTCTFANPAGTFMHYANANVLTITAVVHDWLTPGLAGTTLPQTPPFN